MNSWDTNAAPWIETVRNDELESRRVATNAAVVEAVARLRPGSALDLGCGEGWLTRALAGLGIEMTGVDASKQLIAAAQDGVSRFLVGDYASLGDLGSFDVVVCNFALFDEDVEPVLRWVSGASERFVMQTTVASSEGWQTESWGGFARDFREPFRYYQRTPESWLALLERAGFEVEAEERPVHPQTGKTLSLLVTARRARGA